MSWPQLTPLAAAVLHVGTPERILLLECGEAEGALFLAREFPRARVRGVDRSRQAVRRASERIGLDPEGRLAFKVASPRSLPFPADHFDLVAAVDASPAAAETARVLRDGGCLVLASSRSSSPLPGLRGRLLGWRLARSGLEPLRSEASGDGSFSVLRLGGADAAPGSV
ncbi:MAG TPA: class I SAM-dependent methyltransferase [Solirubrobacterales bacterium]|nr:class I SAM-dependent methyltransferase [Solirubrobacterales bacterium]